MCIDFFVYKQKTADVLRISDWSSDVCSSDLLRAGARSRHRGKRVAYLRTCRPCPDDRGSQSDRGGDEGLSCQALKCAPLSPKAGREICASKWGCSAGAVGGRRSRRSCRAMRRLRTGRAMPKRWTASTAPARTANIFHSEERRVGKEWAN